MQKHCVLREGRNWYLWTIYMKFSLQLAQIAGRNSEWGKLFMSVIVDCLTNNKNIAEHASETTQLDSFHILPVLTPSTNNFTSSTLWHSAMWRHVLLKHLSFSLESISSWKWTQHCQPKRCRLSAGVTCSNVAIICIYLWLEAQSSCTLNIFHWGNKQTKVLQGVAISYIATCIITHSKMYNYTIRVIIHSNMYNYKICIITHSNMCNCKICIIRNSNIYNYTRQYV